MSEKLEKLRAMLEKEKDRRIKLNNRIEILERRIQEAEAAEVNEMVRTAKVTPEQLAALLRQSATSTPNPAALAAVGATFDKEDQLFPAFFLPVWSAFGGGQSNDPDTRHDGGARSRHCRLCAEKILHGGSGTDQRFCGIQPPHF